MRLILRRYSTGVGVGGFLNTAGSNTGAVSQAQTFTNGIRTTGSIGIGTASPSANLDIVSEADGFVATGYRAYAGATTWYSGAGIAGVSIAPYFIGNSNNGVGSKLSIYPSGNTGIGYDTEVSAKLAVNGLVDIAASTTAASSLRLRHGVAPTSPNDGDMWTTTAGLYVRINGATVGPLS